MPKQAKQPSSPRPRPEAHNAFSLKGSCRYCNKSFPKKREWQKFCNKQCKNNYWNLQYALDAQANDEDKE